MSDTPERIWIRAPDGILDATMWSEIAPLGEAQDYVRRDLYDVVRAGVTRTNDLLKEKTKELEALQEKIDDCEYRQCPCR